MMIRSTRALVGAFALAATGLTALPVSAQDAAGEARIRKLEAEVRAIQRQVFPGGGKMFEPQITNSTQGAANGPTTPSTTAVTDILIRLDALEAQMQSLTAQTEQNANSLSQMQIRLAALEAGTAPVTGAPAVGTAPAAGIPAVTATNPSASSATSSSQPAATTPSRPAATGPSAQRLAAVQAIAKPQTADAGDDEYSYGFRLWEAKFFPEAQQQLALFAEKYPRHERISFGRNLLGRAYLDDGKARDAATWFLRNYQADKNGARAGDSLLYLAESMIVLKDTSRACIALSEFSETYPALATGRLATPYNANRQKVTCN